MRPTRAEFVTDDLHKLVNAAGLKPPFVLVGWSAGGVFVRRYFHDYPDGIIGMVFVDSSHEQQRHRLERSGQHGAAATRRGPPAHALSRARVDRRRARIRRHEADGRSALHMPADLEAEMVAMENRTNYCAGIAHEAHGFESDVSQADPPASLGDLPLVVLTRGRASSAKDFPTPLSQAELDQRSIRAGSRCRTNWRRSRRIRRTASSRTAAT